MKKISVIFLLLLAVRPAGAELAFTGAGANQCQLLNSSAAPARGSAQNQTTMLIFSWVQGYMSGFNGYSMMINQGTFDLAKASNEAQWEYIVSFCRSNPHEYIVKAIQELQLRLLQKQ